MTALLHVGMIFVAIFLFKTFYSSNNDKSTFHNTLPGAAAPYIIESSRPPGEILNKYPGAVPSIESGEYEYKGLYRGGLTDREIMDILPDGNPMNLGRDASPAAACPCIDDEANNDEIDGDERITYQLRARNDETRVIAGLMNRRSELDKFLREEVEQEENSRWWGRQEI